MTPAADLLYHFPKGGRLASLLLHDWYAGIGTGEVAPLPPCLDLRPLRPIPNVGADHDFFTIPSQTRNEPEDLNKVFACICKHCRYHFVFHVDTTPEQQQPDHIEHHFVTSDSFLYPDDVADQNRLKPVVRETTYSCSSCETVVRVTMLRPRLRNKWMEVITDENRIRRSLKLARQNDPERYADTTPEKEAHYVTSPLATLNAYLKNILNDDGTMPRKRISARNKTFTVQFGTECEYIFKYLGFEKEEDDDGEIYWLPPKLIPQGGKTPLWSERAFYEDVKSEVQSILDNSPLSSSLPVVRPVSPARELLASALGCEFPRGRTRLDLEHVHFRLLGVPDTACESQLQYAYSRQVVVDGEHKQQYLEALGHLAATRTEDFQLFVIHEQEIHDQHVREKQSIPGPVRKAYARFGLPDDGSVEPDQIVGAFKNYMEQFLTHKHEPRVDLLKIAKHLDNNPQIREVALNLWMSHEEACDVFGVETTTDLNFVSNVATSNIELSDADYRSLALKALGIILNSRDSSSDGYFGLKALYDSLCDQDSAASPQNLSGLDVNMRSGFPPGINNTVDMTLPVGITNIGNTCYLNSILQYFYSIHLIRDFVMTCSKLENEDIRGLAESSGLPEKERNQVFIGYHCARDLGCLFEEMETSQESAVKPKQRVANTALIRIDRLRVEQEGKGHNPTTKDDQRPPLPPRVGVNSSTDAADVPLPPDDEAMETASNASSETLVGINDTGEDTTNRTKTADEKPETVTDAVAGPPAPAPAVSAPAVYREYTLDELEAQIDKDVTGSEQMDVEEIMSLILEHLDAAMKHKLHGDPSPIDPHFFSRLALHKQKLGEDWACSNEPAGFLAAIPAESAPRELYDALATQMGFSGNGSLVEFKRIQTPATIVRILIPRAQERQGGTGAPTFKNLHPVKIPFEIFLDRFMYGGDNETFEMQKKFFNVSKRLEEIEAAINSDRELESLDDDFFMVEDTDLPDPAEGYEVIDRPAPESEGKSASVSVSVSVSELDDLWRKFVQQEEEHKIELSGNQNELAQEITSGQKFKYRLHAVFLHRGSGTKTGHYIVWLYDFKRERWHEYNDETVKVVDSNNVIRVLTNSFEPYYLSYVEDQDLDSLVSIPSRQATVQEDVDMMDAPGTSD